jgi:hypothetical protein
MWHHAHVATDLRGFDLRFPERGSAYVSQWGAEGRRDRARAKIAIRLVGKGALLAVGQVNAAAEVRRCARPFEQADRASGRPLIAGGGSPWDTSSGSKRPTSIWQGGAGNPRGILMVSDILLSLK